MKIFKKQSNKFFTTKLLNKMSGFTIIETLVAVFILSLAITSFMGLTSRSLMASRYARNEIIANYLAQEAADYIRNQRDELAFMGGGDWSTFINYFNQNSTKTCFSAQGCYLKIYDISADKVITCPEGGCPLLDYRDEGSSFYYYGESNNSVDSIFKRTITMEDGSGDIGSKEIYVSVRIDWKNGGADKSKVLNFSLSDWYNF